MTKEQAIKANKEKGRKTKELIKSLGDKEYQQRYVGNYKGHIKKIKSLFNSNKIQFTNTDQISKGLADYILTEKHIR